MCMVGNWFAGRLPCVHCNNVISLYDNSFALKVESIQWQNHSLWYLLPTEIKTEDTGQFKSTLSDSRLLYFQIYVWQAIASFGARDSRSTVKGTKMPAVYQQLIFNRKAAVNWTWVWPAVLQLSRVIKQTFISRPTRLISITTFLPRVWLLCSNNQWKRESSKKLQKNPHAQLCSSRSHVGNQVKQPHTRQRKQHSVVQLTILLKIIKWLQNDLAPDRVKESASQLNKNRIEDKETVQGELHQYQDPKSSWMLFSVNNKNPTERKLHEWAVTTGSN